jgi:hypothetical protein
MRAMPDDEVERQPMNPRREEARRKLAAVETRARVLAQRHGRLAAGIALTAAAAFALGMIVYRNRQRTTVVRRVQNAIPDSVWELPEELVTQLRKQVQRAAKAL